MSAPSPRMQSKCCHLATLTWLPDGYSQILRSYAFGLSGLKECGSATIHCKFCHLATLQRRIDTKTPSLHVRDWLARRQLRRVYAVLGMPKSSSPRRVCGTEPVHLRQRCWRRTSLQQGVYQRYERCIYPDCAINKCYPYSILTPIGPGHNIHLNHNRNTRPSLDDFPNRPMLLSELDWEI